MQNVTPDRPINKNCELHAAKKFREWQPAFIKHKISQAIGFSKGYGGVRFSYAHVWVRIVFQDYYMIYFIDL